MSLQSALLSRNPVAYYQHQESSGTTAIDDANSRNGTYTGDYSLADANGPCVGSVAAYFDGTAYPGATGGYVDIPDEAAFRILGDITLFAYVRADPSSAGFREIFGKTLSNIAAPYDFLTNDLTPMLSRGNGSAQVSATCDVAFSGAAWHRLFIRQVGTTVTFIIDGAQAGATKTLSATIADQGTNPRIAGRDDLANWWHGGLAHVALFGYGLSDDDIEAIDDASSDCGGAFIIQTVATTIDVPQVEQPRVPAPVPVDTTITFNPGLARGKLGCGIYQVFLQRRGGGKRLALLPWRDLSYAYRVDDMTSANVALGECNDEASYWLSVLNPWEHEIAIYRSGVEAWVGVVEDPVFTNEQTTISARDLFWWFERRIHPVDRDMETDLADIFEQFVIDGLSRDTSPNIVVSSMPTGILGHRVVTAAEKKRVADSLRELSRSGVDFTMIGRTLLCGGEEVPTDTLAVLTADVLLQPSLTPKGSLTGSEITVRGGSAVSGLSSVIGIAGGVDPDIGLVELIFDESSILDQASVDHAAETRLDMLGTPPLFFTATLDPEAPVNFESLIPGARVEIRTTVGPRRVFGPMRLESVDVSARNESGGEESVKVNLIPLGTTVGAGA